MKKRFLFVLSFCLVFVLFLVIPVDAQEKEYRLLDMETYMDMYSTFELIIRLFYFRN